eukprot:gene11482-13387_t
MDGGTTNGTTDPFSKYQIGEAVGKGAFGKVFKALNTETGDFCAIKQIEKFIISEKQLPAILQEIKLLQTLQHVNIVKFIESHETSKFLFFALEFIEGGSLAKMSKRYGNFQEPLLSRYICQVLRGLDYLHAKGVIHRDIKSDNILITKEGVIKLADFGSCTYSALDKKLTVVGTPFWMAPEVIQMDMNARSTACDIWSLGCTILELLTGNPPYWDLGTMPAMFAMVNNPHPPLPANISQELKGFLLACFVRDINKRPTASQLLEHPWIKMHHMEPAPSRTPLTNSGKISVSMNSEGYENSDQNEDDGDLKAKVAQLESQKKDMNQTINKLKYHFLKAMKEKKAMKEMISQLVHERDGYMLKLGLTPPPPPSILNSSSTPSRSAMESANEMLNGGGSSSGGSHGDSPNSKHIRSSSAPITPPLKIASSSPSPSTAGAPQQSSFKSTNILNNDFFAPPDSDSDDENSPQHDYILSPFADLHMGRTNKKVPPKLTKYDSELLENTSNPNLGAYFSTGPNMHVYQGGNVNPPHAHDVNLNIYSNSPSQYSIGGSLNVGNDQNGAPSIGIGAGSGSLKTTLGTGGRKIPVLQRETSQKSSLNMLMSASPRDRRDSIGSGKSPSDVLIGAGMSGMGSGGGSIGSSTSLSVPRKSSHASSHSSLPSLSLNQSQDKSLSASTGGGDEDEKEGGDHSVPPVESVVVNVQPPRVGDECKVKCGEGWYDAIVELVSGTSFVVTIKPFNIKQEVSHSDVTLAPLQFPVNTKKKSKFSIFGKSGKT